VTEDGVERGDIVRGRARVTLKFIGLMWEKK
jgi:hypothetical protein